MVTVEMVTAEVVTAEARGEQGERKICERRMKRAGGNRCVYAHTGAGCRQWWLGCPVIHAGPE